MFHVIWNVDVKDFEIKIIVLMPDEEDNLAIIYNHKNIYIEF